MKKIHFDTDLVFGGDIDDLCALAYLLNHPEVEVTGITTVVEDGGRRAGYVRHVLHLAGRQYIPFCSGTEVSEWHYRSIPVYPVRQKEYWEPIAPPYQGGGRAKLFSLLRSSIEQGATIVCAGPLTNLFLFDQEYPGVLATARIVIVGGYLQQPREGYPAWGNEMDYNLQFDVAAAQYILERFPVTLVQLPVTLQTALCQSDIPALASSGSVGELVASQARIFDTEWNNAEKLGKIHAKLPNDIINFQYDPLGCAVGIGWEGFVTEEVDIQVAVVDGWLQEKIVPSGMGNTVTLVTDVDGDAFRRHWREVVTRA